MLQPIKVDFWNRGLGVKLFLVCAGQKNQEEGGGVRLPQIFLHISFRWVKIRVHTRD